MNRLNFSDDWQLIRAALAKSKVLTPELERALRQHFEHLGDLGKSVQSGQPNTTVNITSSGSTSSVTQVQGGYQPFKIAAAGVGTVNTGHVVTLSLGGTVSLATASDINYVADAVVTGVSRDSTGNTVLEFATGGTQLVQLAAPLTLGRTLYLSAVSPGKATDNISESTTKLFNQEIGKFVSYYIDSSGTVSSSLAYVDLHLSPAASVVASA